MEMNMYVLTKDGSPVQFPYSVQQLFQDNPHTSFPLHPTEQTLTSYGVFPVYEVEVQYDTYTQEATVTSCAFNAMTDRWETVYTIRDLTAEELQEGEAIQASSIRAERDRLLLETDWVIVKSMETSAPVPAEWLSYRRALRDITLQEGFPPSVTWPVKP
jgi:type VI protein secretion system component VasA